MKIFTMLCSCMILLGCDNVAAPASANSATSPIAQGTISSTNLIRGGNVTFNSDTYPTLYESAFDTWKSWGIKLIRFTFDKDDFTNVYSNPPTVSDYSTVWVPYTTNIAKLKIVLDWMKARSMKAMISLDHIWGDDHDSDDMWASNGVNDYLKHRIDLCKAMASWIHDNGFDTTVEYLEPWNEPHSLSINSTRSGNSSTNLVLYRDYFLPAAMSAIRSVNTTVSLSIMPPYDWGQLFGLSGWSGVTDSANKVVYSTHFYAPQTYTHQGVLSGYPRLSTGWPGTYKNFPSDPSATYMDLAAGRPLTQIIKDFRTSTGKKVIVTEFACIRWAKDSGYWIRDVVSLFEESDIDWLYHGIAGWNGWNPSFGPNDPQNKEVFGPGTPSLDLLKKYWILP